VESIHRFGSFIADGYDKIRSLRIPPSQKISPKLTLKTEGSETTFGCQKQSLRIYPLNISFAAMPTLVLVERMLYFMKPDLQKPFA
jgi:hypothetical protein